MIPKQAKINTLNCVIVFFDVLYHDKARLGLFTKLSAVLIHRAFLIRKKMSTNVAITSIGDILCEMVRSLKTQTCCHVVFHLKEQRNENSESSRFRIISF